MKVQDPPARTMARYCYGVTWADAAGRQTVAGLAGAPVEAVTFEDLAALTSPIASAKVRAKRRDVLSHSEVLTAALADATVLPLRFGVVFESAEAVVDDFLRPRHGELVGLLREFDGRVELTVRALYREAEILAEVVRENPRIAQLREATRTRDAAATHPLRVQLGELVAGELQVRTQRDQRELLDRLLPLALAVEIDPDPIEHQVLRASFLVERDRVPKFDEAMDELARNHAGRIDFKYLGPLPPHSFVSLTPLERA